MRRLAGTTAWVALLLAAPAGLARGAEDAGVKLRVATAIARFAELPTPRARGDGPLHWCIATQGRPTSAQLALQGQKMGTLEVKLQIAPPFQHCDVLYVDSSFADWRSLLGRLQAPTLTVSDIPGLESDAVRFDVNLRALRAKSIRLPSQVLSLAREVRN
jgi:hypothetical protein